MANLNTLHRHAARVLPEVIKTSGVFLEENGQRELAAMLFPLRRKSSGAVLFRFSTAMAEAMDQDPLAYLEKATRAREGLGRHCAPFAYRGWRRAWIPAHWISTLPGSNNQSIAAGGKRVQVCFTTQTDGRALLVVIPAKRLVAYLWRD